MTLDELRKLTPRDIARMTDAEARSAYSALRKGFIKQLKRLEGAGYKRPLTSSDIPKVSQIPAASLKKVFSDVARISRDPQFSLSKINKRITGTKKWMKKHGFKNVTDETAKAFGDFMGRLKDSGVTSDAKPKRYVSAIELAREEHNNGNNLEDVREMFEKYMDLKDAGADMTGFENGEIFGINISSAVRHKKSISKYSEILKEFANDPDYEKPRTEKDVENLLRRARREYNRRAKR